MENSKRDAQTKWTTFLSFAPVWIIFVLGLYFIVLKRYGLHWESVPGDLGDGRFNNYILEHLFLWMKGALTPSSYWDAGFFYPFKRAITFSDNLWGAAPIYVFFRWVGASRETAFQWWYLFGFVFNYAACVYVLSRAKFKPLAVGAGAFFFTFGIPILAQGGHLQLYYRFGIPLACFFLLEFFKQPKLMRLAAVVFWLVWQFYLSIYLGVFLMMLLVALALLAPCFEKDTSLKEKIVQWPKKIKQAWLESGMNERFVSIFAIALIGICFLGLLWPYYESSKYYGLVRIWSDLSDMLPTPESFLIADGDPFWMPISALFGKTIKVRHEHQLFPGIAIAVMLVIGLIILFRSKNNQITWLYLCSIIFLIIITLNFNGLTFYWFLWQIPGINSLRAIARIQLVWLWPLSFFVAWTLNKMLQWAEQKTSWLFYISSLLLIALLMAESIYTPQSYSLIADSLSRIRSIKNSLPGEIPQDPILALSLPLTEFPVNGEIDAMLTAQELGWPTLNGYSGNAPPDYILIRTCRDVRFVLKRYVDTLGLEKKEKLHVYSQYIKRVVLVGFHIKDCGPNWQELPEEMR